MESLGLVGQGPMTETNQYYDSSKIVGQRMTMKVRLEMAVAEAEKKLADVKRAKEIFEKNPDLEELLNIMGRSNF